MTGAPIQLEGCRERRGNGTLRSGLFADTRPTALGLADDKGGIAPSFFDALLAE